MKIKNIEGLTFGEVQNEVNNGARFVIYSYTISIIVMTFKRTSDIYFIKSDEKSTVKGLPYTFISLVTGWWGIPWGPIYTVGSLYSNLRGGKDVTGEAYNAISSGSLINHHQESINRTIT